MLRPVPSASLTIVLGAVLALAQSPTPPPPAPAALNPVQALNAADVQQALALIRNNYVGPDLLNETELNRATLAGLLARLGPNVTLLPDHGAAPPPPPFYRELIAGHIGYLRPGALNKADLQDLDATLRNFAGKKVDALILDLRAVTAANDYASAAEFAKRFVPNGKPLFILRGPGAKTERAFSSNQEPAYSGFVVLLIDSETSGAAEVLASVVRLYDRAIAIGETTAGRGVEYSDLSLPSGKMLRIAVAEAVLPDQRACFPEGLKPDLPVPLAREAKRQIFQQSVTTGVSPFIVETDRPHLNEAALLAGTNPEIEAAQAAQQHRGREGDKPPLHDAPLQRAIDLITSIEIYQKQPGRAP